jgi:hypothetical protein
MDPNQNPEHKDVDMRKTLASTALALMVAAAPLTAQSFGFGAHAGVSIPTGDYADGVDLGFSGGLDLWYPIGDFGLSWYTSADAVAHNVDSDAIDGGFLYVPVMTGARFDIPAGPVSLFLTGQGGVILTKGPDYEGAAGAPVAYAESNFGTTFGFNVGGGVQVTDHIYAGVKYYPLGDVEFDYENEGSIEGDVSFFDVYVGFGVK